MNGYYIFIAAFVLLGLYALAVGVYRLLRLDRKAPDYAEKRKRQFRSIVGSLGLFLIAAMIYCFRIMN